jgi:hypothetical protein
MGITFKLKNDVNKHINDFTLYMDKLQELGREQRRKGGDPGRPILGFHN